jgi:hypothetical protein
MAEVAAARRDAAGFGRDAPVAVVIGTEQGRDTGAAVWQSPMRP